MTASDLLTVILAVVSLVTVAALALVLAHLVRTTRELRAALARLESETLPAVARAAEQVALVDAELHRVDGLLDRTDRVTARAETISKVTYQALAKPVINTAAVVKGTSRAAQRLRRRNDEVTG